MSCDYICQMIQKAVLEYQKHNDLANTVLVIDLKQVTDNIDVIPKIEYKNSPS